MRKLVFGYGSLLSARSRAHTLQRPSDVFPAVLPGFQRVWNARSSQLGGGISFLGLEPTPGATCLGVLFEVNDAEFERLAQREGAYTATPLTVGDFQMLKPSPWTADRAVVVYCFCSDDRPDADFPIVQSYLDLCLEGCLEAEALCLPNPPKPLAHQFVEETKGWSKHWVNDRVHARRPFVDYPLALRIDAVIRHTLPEFVDHIRI